jgi:aryl-alcohol dehydrogenase-like predicted oxidoreductase
MGGFISDLMQPKVLQAVQQLKPLAEQAGTSMSRFALAWILREPNVASAIVGASSTQQLDDNAAASGLDIDPKLFAAADAALSKVARF